MKLHTELLEEKYGPITVKVIKQNNSIREVHLMDPFGISRTYASTFFTNKIAYEIRKIHKEIKAGAPIGKSFKKYEYEINNKELYYFLLKLPKWLRLDFQTKEKYAPTRTYEFWVNHKTKSFFYGTIVEVYCPDFILHKGKHFSEKKLDSEIINLKNKIITYIQRHH